MLYTAQKGDTVFTIAKKFGVSADSLLDANSLCNTEYLAEGIIVSIPVAGQFSRRCGSLPYYVTQPGDTLESVAARFRIPPDLLRSSNDITGELFPYQELLIVHWVPEARKLRDIWENAVQEPGNLPLQSSRYKDLSFRDMHHIFYNGSFLWEAMGKKAIPSLEALARHPCDLIRLYAVISLARLAGRKKTVSVDFLKRCCKDPDPLVARMTECALERARLAAKGLSLVHITTAAVGLFKGPYDKTPAITLKRGTRITVLQWNIPGPLTCDHVQLVESGIKGFIPRYLYDEIPFV